MSSTDYQRGYSSGYQAGVKRATRENPPPPPQPEWVKAIAELGQRLGRESFAKVCRGIANAHAETLATEAVRHAPSIDREKLLAELHATIEPILSRIEQP